MVNNEEIKKIVDDLVALTNEGDNQLATTKQIKTLAESVLLLSEKVGYVEMIHFQMMQLLYWEITALTYFAREFGLTAEKHKKNKESLAEGTSKKFCEAYDNVARDVKEFTKSIALSEKKNGKGKRKS